VIEFVFAYVHHRAGLPEPDRSASHHTYENITPLESWRLRFARCWLCLTTPHEVDTI
jgi:hypothetical protein